MRPLLLLLLSGFCAAPAGFDPGKPELQLSHSFSIDSLGACQGISWLQGKAYLYGDREVGMVRQFDLRGDSLLYTGHEYKLTLNDTDVINHPTGLAVHGKDPVFMGNSVLLDRATHKWKAIIYCIDWPGLQRTGTLDGGNLRNVIEDDACIQGTRPEYVEFHHKWYVATQNQVEGRKWRFSFVDLARSLESGQAEVVKVVDSIDRGDELEGFTFLSTVSKGVAVTSSRRGNVHFMDINW